MVQDTVGCACAVLLALAQDGSVSEERRRKAILDGICFVPAGWLCF